MRMRAAFISNGLADLRAALSALASGDDRLWQRAEVAARPLFDPAAQVAASLTATPDLATAAAWCGGAELHPEPAPRLHLPVYRFEGPTHWFRAPELLGSAPAAILPTPQPRIADGWIDRLIEGDLTPAQMLRHLQEDVT